MDHPNVIKGHGFVLEKRQAMIFMELMKESIKQNILRSEEKKIDENKAFAFLQQALEGLVYLHHLSPKPIIHRNLKCSNNLRKEIILVAGVRGLEVWRGGVGTVLYFPEVDT